MKKITIGIFGAREDAEKAINEIHNALKVSHDDISYTYRNTEGDVKEVNSEKVSSSTPGEGAVAGAKIGGALGAIAGIAAFIGALPVFGPLVAAGSIATALGLTGAIGATAAGSLTGAAAGSMIGALANLGVGKEQAKRYSDRVMAGDILVSVNADEDLDIREVMEDHGAIDVNVYKINV